MDHSGRLVITCPDGPGIVAAVSEFLFRHGANIVQSDQYSTDPQGGTFFMRMAFRLEGLDLPLDQLGRAFADEVAERFAMDWRLHDAAEPKRVAVMVSREDHCLLDLLWRWRRGELQMDVGLVISNRIDLAETVSALGIPFEHTPVTAGTKAHAEARQLELLAGRFDLVVLARYMTEVLDGGPIIEQDVIRVTHGDDVDALERLGRDIERSVLSRAVRWHCEDRVLRHGERTVVF